MNLQENIENDPGALQIRLYVFPRSSAYRLIRALRNVLPHMPMLTIQTILRKGGKLLEIDFYKEEEKEVLVKVMDVVQAFHISHYFTRFPASHYERDKNVEARFPEEVLKNMMRSSQEIAHEVEELMDLEAQAAEEAQNEENNNPRKI